MTNGRVTYASIRLGGEHARDALSAVATHGGSWVRFGTEALVYAPADAWQGVAGRLETAGRGAEAPTGTVRAGQLHLVVQKGRVFQREHPEARVILDKGRYLVVEMPKVQARRLSGRPDPCFRIEPLRANSVVFEERPARRDAPAPSPGVADVVAGLDRALFETALARLVAFRTRLSTRPEYAAAAAWASDELAALGLNVRLEPVRVGDGQSSNVIATKPGVGHQDRGVVLIVAHLDSINHPGGPSADAPGADDNASGSAGVVALAAALARHRFAHDLAFILFGGEEQGLLGSTQHLEGLTAAERGRIRGVLNMDMIGSVNVRPPAVLLEGAELSQDMIDGLALAAEQFTPLTVQTSLNPFASDHVPFIQAGIPAVLTIEGADGANDAIHTANDTLDRVSADFAMQILAMNAGFLAVKAEVAEQPQPAPGCGCGGSANAPAPGLTQAVNQLSAHYQALFAQYARLHRDNRTEAQDLVNWQAALTAHEGLAGGPGRAPPRGA